MDIYYSFNIFIIDEQATIIEYYGSVKVKMKQIKNFIMAKSALFL